MNKGKIQDVDHTDLFNEIVGFGPFHDFESFRQRFQKFQDDTGTVFNKCAGSLVEYENTRRKKKIHEKFLYVSIKFQCIHYGNPKPKSTGQRPNQKYLPCGCGAAFRLVYRKEALCVTSSHLIHHNHEVNLKSAKSYRKVIRLSSNTSLGQYKPKKNARKKTAQEDIDEHLEMDLSTSASENSDHYLCSSSPTASNQGRPQLLSMAQRWAMVEELVGRVSRVLREAEDSHFQETFSQINKILSCFDKDETPSSNTELYDSLPPSPVRYRHSSIMVPLDKTEMLHLEETDKIGAVLTYHRVGGGINIGENNSTASVTVTRSAKIFSE